MTISIHTKKIKRFFKKGIVEAKRIAAFWSASKAGTFGSSVAYYAIFSFTPVLVIAIAITSFFISRTTATASILAQFTSVFGKNGATLVDALLKVNISPSTGITASIIGGILILVGAIAIFSELQSALNAIFESLPVKGKRGFWSTIRRKVLSFGMVVSVGFLLLVSLTLSAAVTFLTSSVNNLMPAIGSLASFIESVLSLVLFSFFFALMYKVLPSHRLRWKPALVGGLIAGTLFILSKYVLSAYLGSSSFDSYGPASALVLLVIWTYYMAQMFFFAAVLTRLYVVPKVK